MPNDFRPVSPRLVPRFAGVSTFLRLPLHDDPRDVDALIVGAPFDGGTSFRPGARFGPRGVRTASALTRGFHPDPGLDLFEHLRCADGGDVLCVPMDLARSLANIEARAHEIAAAGAIPAFVGGDHDSKPVRRTVGVYTHRPDGAQPPKWARVARAVRTG
jgi:arginase family enzyme